ncbi:MFS transporter [Nocardioides coralli]|uniref:MFS transporter n=1 Tax=Nocardioides coralli TaxID=2872154 RepID=UPI001CA42D40|nr:MFS transporter [Nocardioides coralli]QZY27848.1 MFS transporter [Nocardioides coralli]
MLDSYRRILSVPGGLRFSTAAFVARLPISMMGLGIVLLVAAGTGSYGLAGSVSAAYVVANATLSILQGRLLDRLGQARVLAPAAVLFTFSSGLLVVSVDAGWARWATYLLAACSGATLPAAGACVRARWSYVLAGRPADLQTAFALEAVVDEAVFITGPILVTLLATAIDPGVGLAAAVASGLVGTLALALQRRTEPPVSAAAEDDPAAARAGLPWRTLVPLLAVAVGLGCLFGAAEVVTVAWAEERGNQVYAGPLLALWALGSLAAGVVTGAVHWRQGPAVRLRWGAAGMCAAMAPLSFIGSVPIMGLALLVGGLAIAPTLIAATSLTEQVVPPARLTEGMTVLQTAIVGGVAPGAAVAGLVVDRAGSGPAYLVALAAGAVAAVAAQAVPRSGQ